MNNDDYKAKVLAMWGSEVLKLTEHDGVYFGLMPFPVVLVVVNLSDSIRQDLTLAMYRKNIRRIMMNRITFVLVA